MDLTKDQKRLLLVRTTRCLQSFICYLPRPTCTNQNANAETETKPISIGERVAIELARRYGLSTEPPPLIDSDLHHDNDDLFEFKPVSCDEVRKLLATMPSNKAPGYDKVPMSAIKDCLEHILPVITKLINNSFNQSVFPKAWKKGEVVPLLKEGDHEVPNNNRIQGG